MSETAEHTEKTAVNRVRLILGDQLNIHHSWFSRVDDSTLYVMAEQRSETDYTLHHAQKLIGVLSAMRAFARELESRGHRVRYFRLGDADNGRSFHENISRLFTLSGARSFEWQQPDEYRLERELESLADSLTVSPAGSLADSPADSLADSPAGSMTDHAAVNTRKFSTEHFISTPEDFDPLVKNGKIPTMERFYRRMRKTTGILMEDDRPVGGTWNYDSENRSPLKDASELPSPPYSPRNEEELWKEICHEGVECFGSPNATEFFWPKTRAQAQKALNIFLEKRLENFGIYQDAMVDGEPFLYHSLISFALNIKLISPGEVIESARKKWGQKAREDERMLASLEGFIRQILGWREYMRQVYRHGMPGYGNLNHFNAHRPLPSWYWDGKTSMNCLSKVVSQSLEHGYAHHIQRLMITGNFAMLAGVDPDQVDFWYLGVYIDAFQWVEITNTRGMSQYADGGKVATKPYAASASYINRMSDYCKGCSYNKNLRHGENACPFNSLYWHFLHRNRSILADNHRLAMPYRTWDRFDPEEKKAILKYGDNCLSNIEQL